MKYKIVLEVETEEDFKPEEMVKLFENLFEETYEIDGVDLAIQTVTYLDE